MPSVLIDTAKVVWPGAPVPEVTRSIRQAPGTSDWMVLPRVGAPRWLLPADASGTAAVLGGQDATTAKRAAVHVLALAQRAGLVHRLPVRRLRVGGPGEQSLVAALQEMVGPEVDVAIRLGSWRHARSVVVRLFGADGTTVAFGKVGIDEVGRAAVRAEARALARIAELDLGQVVHSDVLGRATWRTLDVLLVSPLLPPERTGNGDLPDAAMRELAGARGSRTGLVAESAWSSLMHRRTGEIMEPTLREEIRSHLRRLSRASVALPVPLGPCHGDWTPWNMSRDGSRVLLWDWEHFGEDVPAGFDHIHYLAQELRVSTGTGPAAEAAWLPRAHEALEGALELGPRQRDLVIASYLLDVNLRFVLDRQGTPQARDARAGWGLELLRRHVAALQVGPT